MEKTESEETFSNNLIESGAVSKEVAKSTLGLIKDYIDSRMRILMCEKLKVNLKKF